jgi:REP element-mobilizing transposase RayT
MELLNPIAGWSGWTLPVLSQMSSCVRESKHELGDRVLIPDHVHIALRPMGDQDLASTIRSIKGSSAAGLCGSMQDCP